MPLVFRKGYDKVYPTSGIIPAVRRALVRLKAGREQKILHGYPWVQVGEILSVEGSPEQGEAGDGSRLAWALAWGRLI